MIFTKAAKQILSHFPKGKDISGKVGIEVHTSSPLKDDRHGQGNEYLTTFSTLGLNSRSSGSCFSLEEPKVYLNWGLFKLSFFRNVKLLELFYYP